MVQVDSRSCSKWEKFLIQESGHGEAEVEWSLDSGW